MKNLYKLLLFTFISTNITAHYQIGDTYEDGIIYVLHYHQNIYGQNILQIKIVEMENHLTGNIFDVQNANNYEILDGWNTPTFEDMAQISSFRHILNQNELFNDFSTDYSYWTSNHEDNGYVVLEFSPINGGPPHSLYGSYINDNEEVAHLRLVRSIGIPWGNDM